MDRNENLFLLLEFLRTELKTLRASGISPVQLAELLADIEKVVQRISCCGSHGQAMEQLESTIRGIRHAQWLAKQGSCSESALVARTSLTHLLISEDLFLGTNEG